MAGLRPFYQWRSILTVITPSRRVVDDVLTNSIESGCIPYGVFFVGAGLKTCPYPCGIERRVRDGLSIHLFSQVPSSLIERKEILVAPSVEIAARIFRQPTEERSRPLCPFVILIFANQRSEHEIGGLKGF